MTERLWAQAGPAEGRLPLGLERNIGSEEGLVLSRRVLGLLAFSKNKLFSEPGLKKSIFLGQASD